MMSEYDSANGDGGGDEAASVLDRAIHAVRSQSLSEDALEQTLARVRSRTSASRSRRRHFRGSNGRRWLVAGGAAAALLAAATIWLWRPTASWADVAEALRGKLWIHAVLKVRGAEVGEFWFSPEREVHADRRGDWARFDDNRLNVRYEYDLQQQQILRTVPPDKEEGRSFAELFRGIARGQVRVGLTLSGREIVAQEQRRIVEDGRQWLEYDLTLRITYDLASNRRERMRFRVDAESHLPRSMSLSVIAPVELPAGGPDQETMEFVFDYPDEGPRDIYDLGVPRAAKLIDHVPTAELSRLLVAVQSGRNRFDPYFAIVLQQGKDQRWYDGTPNIIWRKGNRWRAEIGALTKMPPTPELDVDRIKWWKEQLPLCTFSPVEVCDGETVYRVKFGQPDALGNQTHTWEAVRRLSASDGIAVAAQGRARGWLPELHAYPPALAAASNEFTVNVVEHPTAGPNDSLLVQYAGTAALKLKGVFRDCRYWVDPAKGYVTRQYVLADARNADGSEMIDTYTMEELDRSPRGIWYPTLVRRKVVQEPRPADPNYVDEIVTRFFVDFDAEIPDDLFRPIDRESAKK